jgi:hypothetical protein
LAGRGFSATWTAPPPITAPPQAQAQSFAIAIRTDIAMYSFKGRRPECHLGQRPDPTFADMGAGNAEYWINLKLLNYICLIFIRYSADNRLAILVNVSF